MQEITKYNAIYLYHILLQSHALHTLQKHSSKPSNAIKTIPIKTTYSLRFLSSISQDQLESKATHVSKKHIYQYIT